jgi:hypothetical protein
MKKYIEMSARSTIKLYIRVSCEYAMLNFENARMIAAASPASLLKS